MSNKWFDIISKEMQQPYFADLAAFVKAERANYTVYPPADKVFNSFNLCPFDKVKVVIVGQDPYHQPHQAMGLSFSVNKGVKIPPSLQNIFQEQKQAPTSGDLTPWARQGVFLLNRILTVRENQPLSHQNKGWEIFTSHILAELYAVNRPLVFMLWGKQAQSLMPEVKRADHLFLCTSHPSPLAVYRGFHGCGHFELANKFLQEHALTAIDWRLP